MKIEELWNKLSAKLPVDEVMGENPNFIIRPPAGSVKVCVGDYGSGVDDQFKRKRSDTFSSVVVLSRHFVKKPIYTIKAFYIADCEDSTFTLRTTEDHTCARYNELWHEMMRKSLANETFEDGFERYSNDKCVEFVSAKDIKKGDAIPFYEPTDELYDCFDGEQSTFEFVNGDKIGSYACDGYATVSSVTCDENKDGCWVYDMEVESGRHVYYANNLLVHNSQFINLAPVTKTMCKKAGIDVNTRFSKLPEDVKKNVVDEAYRILDLVNANVEKLINTNCHTTHGNVLHYALEYIAAEGFYFKKKHYIVHKIIEDDRPCDKFKYSGISVKKAEIPAKMKTFLKDVYESTMTKEWHERDYINAVRKAYENYKSLDWNELAICKKYSTEKEAISTFESEKGAGAHARAANIYNGLIKQLGLGGKYPEIGIGDEVRFAYVIPTNCYGINVIGFKDRIPEEFRSMFTVDYNKMFEIIFTHSLENYVKIMGYTQENPAKQTEDPDFDIF